MNEKAMFNLTYGLFVLSAREGEKDNGCIINTAMQVSSSPNRIAISVNKANYTHAMILRSGEFNISMLDERADFEVFNRFGFQSGRDAEKFANVKASRSSNGILYLEESTNAFLSAKVSEAIDLGSHTMFIADVVDGEVLSSEPSVSYAFYHKNIKPAPQKPKKKGWVCKICGYVYEGEELPKDFICPICKHPASDFEPIE